MSKQSNKDEKHKLTLKSNRIEFHVTSKVLCIEDRKKQSLFTAARPHARLAIALPFCHSAIFNCKVRAFCYDSGSLSILLLHFKCKMATLGHMCAFYLRGYFKIEHIARNLPVQHK